MNQKCFILILILCCTKLISAQQSEKFNKINEHLNTLKKYETNDGFKELENMDHNNFKKFIKEVYEVREIAPKELYQTLQAVIENQKKDNTSSSVAFNAYRVHELSLDMIRGKYSRLTYLLTRIPIFVKATVLSKREIVLPQKYEGRKNRKNIVRNYYITVLKLRSEEIIKGKVDFLNNSEYEVWYINWENVPSQKDFQIGKTYFIPIWYRKDPDIETEYSVATWVSDQGTRFLVENNAIQDEYNVFGFGRLVRWNDFTGKIRDHINKIKNNLEY